VDAREHGEDGEQGVTDVLDHALELRGRGEPERAGDARRQQQVQGRGERPQRARGVDELVDPRVPEDAGEAPLVPQGQRGAAAEPAEESGQPQVRHPLEGAVGEEDPRDRDQRRGGEQHEDPSGADGSARAPSHPCEQPREDRQQDVEGDLGREAPHLGETGDRGVRDVDLDHRGDLHVVPRRDVVGVRQQQRRREDGDPGGGGDAGEPVSRVGAGVVDAGTFSLVGPVEQHPGVRAVEQEPGDDEEERDARVHAGEETGVGTGDRAAAGVPDVGGDDHERPHDAEPVEGGEPVCALLHPRMLCAAPAHTPRSPRGRVGMVGIAEETHPRSTA